MYVTLRYITSLYIKFYVRISETEIQSGNTAHNNILWLFWLVFHELRTLGNLGIFVGKFGDLLLRHSGNTGRMYQGWQKRLDLKVVQR